MNENTQIDNLYYYLLGSTLYLPTLLNDQQSLQLNQNNRNNLSGNFVVISRGFVHYERSGSASGPLIVMLHGFPISSHLWERNFYELAKAGFDVVRFDFYGRGYSDRPDLDNTRFILKSIIRTLNGIRLNR